MAQLDHALLCLAVMTAIWTVIGLPPAIRLFASPHAWLWAPGLGWALTSVVCLPVFEIIGMAVPQVLAVTAAFIALALVVTLRGRGVASLRCPAWLLLGVIAAAVLALGPMAGILPKFTADGVTLASPIFDHSKIAMIDEAIRSGVPITNPFFGEAGPLDHVAYYYLWHFSAAVTAKLTGVSGWEADAALTGFTAFASLLVMIGLALQAGARTSAAVAVVLLAATSSLRTLLVWLWPDGAPAVIGDRSGFGGWLFQSSWAPQHVASAMCVMMACLLVGPTAQRRGLLAPAVLGLVVASAFQSSVWVGGLVLGVAAPLIGLLWLWRLAPEQRLAFLGRLVVSVVLAACLVAPFIHDQLVSASMREGAALIAITPVSVLGPAIPESIRRVLDLPAFWLVYLPVEFPAFYLGGLIGLYALLRRRTRDIERPPAYVLCILAAVSLLTAWLLASVIGDNNDLGWRAVLPGAMILIALTAAAVSGWPALSARAATALAVAGLLLSLPETVKILGENLTGLPKPSERVFASTPAMWEAVRRHTSKTERVANNPLFLADMTPWPANISWALLADRRSCYAGLELAIPFAPVSAQRRAEIEAQFVRVFAGGATPQDIDALASHFHCDAAVVTAQDGAWQRDPFASGAVYRLVDSHPDAWRIYRRNVHENDVTLARPLPTGFTSAYGRR